MKRVKMTSKSAPRIRDVGPTARRIEPRMIAEAVASEPIAKLRSGLPPPALAALREELVRRLGSSGGRPSLAGTQRRQKIPLADADWAQLVALAEQVSDQNVRPTPGQIASAVLRLVLERTDSFASRLRAATARDRSHLANRAGESSLAYEPVHAPMVAGDANSDRRPDTHRRRELIDEVAKLLSKLDPHEFVEALALAIERRRRRV